MTDKPDNASDIAIRLRSHETEGVTSSDRYHLRNEAAAEIDRLRAELSSSESGRSSASSAELHRVPAGWKLVPDEATAEMVQAAEDRQIEGASYIAEDSIQFALWREVWKAMLSAAPSVVRSASEPMTDGLPRIEKALGHAHYLKGYAEPGGADLPEVLFAANAIIAALRPKENATDATTDRNVTK